MPDFKTSGFKINPSVISLDKEKSKKIMIEFEADFRSFPIEETTYLEDDEEYK